MRKVIIWILNILMIGSAAVMIVYEVFFADQINTKMLVKASIVFLTYFLGMFGIIRKKSVFDYKVYEDVYGDIIRNAFYQDKRSYHQLMKAISLYNDNKNQKAIEVLDKLKSMCSNYEDFSAVLMFKALCHRDLKQYNHVVATYEELLKMDHSNSRAWSNLGIAYTNTNRTDLAEQAYQNAVIYDKNNAFAHNNLAVFYANNGEPQKGLASALEALRLNNKMYQAMSAAALCYAYMGNKEEAHKYCKMYRANGGSAKDTDTLRRKVDSIMKMA